MRFDEALPSILKGLPSRRHRRWQRSVVVILHICSGFLFLAAGPFLRLATVMMRVAGRANGAAYSLEKDR
ncbi:hypothetical protein [Telmatospirillum sp.]|uniref:hypothetical protein n=1 Tax=Telmatospirillum sp. TaxID=2079197 RepID=UPI00284D5FDF|nr:hypothetical protein [Telmatospirillum sp.]MDR3438970.1 hypothetical protein [Telmatospirillum sp.]